MAQIIEDGSGTGKKAKVTDNNRLETFSITEQRMADISLNDGEAFIVASDFVALTTTGSFNGLLYIKNDDVTRNVFIDKIRVCGTGTSMNSMQTILTKDPTTGTLISDANAATAIPANFGSTQEFQGTCYSASGDGKTITDGDQASQFTAHLPGHTTQTYNGALILTPGAAIAISVKPGAATTACAEVQCWLEKRK